jgi:hypothetical protein
MARTASPVKGFRLPWTEGAYAYPEADTFAAAKEGFKRRRKSVVFHMPNTGEAGNEECVVCHGTLKEPALALSKPMPNNVRVEHSAATTPDKWSTWYYDPQRKAVVGGRHYICSWSFLLGTISSLGRER